VTTPKHIWIAEVMLGPDSDHDGKWVPLMLDDRPWMMVCALTRDNCLSAARYEKMCQKELFTAKYYTRTRVRRVSL